MLDTHARKYVQPIFDKSADVMIQHNMTPNQITLLAFIIGLFSSVLYLMGLQILAVVTLWISGFFDVLDGTIARKTNQSSPYGTLLDIFGDRCVEVGIILAVTYRHPNVTWLSLLLLCSILLSITVFLTVGALESNKSVKSFHYQAGLAERTEGFLLLSLMMLTNRFLPWVVVIFIVIVSITVIQRFSEARRFFNDRP